METRQKVWDLFKENFDEEDINSTLKRTIQEVGINSLNYIKFIVAIENEFDIEVEDEYLDITQYTYVEDLFNAVEKMISR